MNFNKAIVIGRVTKDPEVRTTPGGQSVASISVATNRVWNSNSGERQEKTEFHNIVAWGKLAEICGEWLKKGKRVYLEGRIQTRSYDDKNTGAKKYITEIVADNMIMLDGGAGRQQESAAAPPSGEEQGTVGAVKNDDLPF